MFAESWPASLHLRIGQSQAQRAAGWHMVALNESINRAPVHTTEASGTVTISCALYNFGKEGGVPSRL